MPFVSVLDTLLVHVRRRIAGRLTAHPDPIIAEVKLGEYNGLHIALRGQAAGIPAIVLGPQDNGFEVEAERLGARYLAADDLQADELTLVIEQVPDAASFQSGYGS